MESAIFGGFLCIALALVFGLEKIAQAIKSRVVNVNINPIDLNVVKNEYDAEN